LDFPRTAIWIGISRRRDGSVISLTQWAFGTNPPPFDGYAWLKAFDPVATIGKTVRLYCVDPAHHNPKVGGSNPSPATNHSNSLEALWASRELILGSSSNGGLTTPVRLTTAAVYGERRHARRCWLGERLQTIVGAAPIL
jgi:hypothetical protein